MKVAPSHLLLALLPLLGGSTCGSGDPDPCDISPDADGDGAKALACGGDDCDDNDVWSFPGGGEVCDLGDRDEDCDPGTYGSRDVNSDGFVDANCCNRAAGGDGEFNCGDDCDDNQAGVHPDAPEVCDGRDGDCDSYIDEAVLMDLYPDEDGDGYGAGDPSEGCFLYPGVSYLGNDCDDDNPAIVPGEMKCLNSADYRICEAGGWSLKTTCGGQGTCVAQPNGTGICI